MSDTIRQNWSAASNISTAIQLCQWFYGVQRVQFVVRRGRGAFSVKMKAVRWVRVSLALCITLLTIPWTGGYIVDPGPVVKATKGMLVCLYLSLSRNSS